MVNRIGGMIGCGVVLVFAVVCFAQTSLPIPVDCPGCLVSGAPPQNVGDFDGDGSDDIAYETLYFDGTTTIEKMCVYSVKKETILLEVSNGGAVQAVGDFNGDGKKELVINYKVYSYTPVLTKKKL